jgi:hypothetical protein
VTSRDRDATFFCWLGCYGLRNHGISRIKMWCSGISRWRFASCEQSSQFINATSSQRQINSSVTWKEVNLQKEMAGHTGQSSQLFPVATDRNAQFFPAVATGRSKPRLGIEQAVTVKRGMRGRPHCIFQNPSIEQLSFALSQTAYLISDRLRHSPSSRPVPRHKDRNTLYGSLPNTYQKSDI